jgi:hypothetical protein
MSETSNLIHPPKRFYFEWLPKIIFHPRQVFAWLAEQTRPIWLTPMLVLTITALALVLASGYLKQQAALMGEAPLPLDFEYYTPEQQAQYYQAMQATQGPVFVYVLPALGKLAGVWIGWLLVGGLLHLVTTLLGGRGETSSSMNIVAWASLPFALRDLVRVIAMLGTRRLIESAGLSGFITASEGSWNALLISLMGLVDIYVIWHMILLGLGVQSTSGLSRSKVISSALLTVLIMLLLQALPGFLVARLGNLTIVRPFFF